MAASSRDVVVDVFRRVGTWPTMERGALSVVLKRLLEEIADGVEVLPVAHLDNVLDAADAKGDGQISIETFLAIVFGADGVAARQPSLATFLIAVRVEAFGVLGTQLSSERKLLEPGLPPDDRTAFVDPAGLHYIQPPGSPAGAAGAAGAIYKWLGIRELPSFPEDVVAKVRRPGDAAYHEYEGGKHAIHAVGPDLRTRNYTWEEAVGELAAAYANVLAEFLASGLPSLRLLPISGGIFSGRLGGTAERLADLTVQSLSEGFGRLAAEQQQRLCRAELAMCVFLEAELQAFRSAFTKGRLAALDAAGPAVCEPPPGGTATGAKPAKPGG